MNVPMDGGRGSVLLVDRREFEIHGRRCRFRHALFLLVVGLAFVVLQFASWRDGWRSAVFFRGAEFFDALLEFGRVQVVVALRT
jgi:hypothetical protein